MSNKQEKLAPITLTKKQKQHLVKKSRKTGETIATTVRALIDKDMQS